MTALRILHVLDHSLPEVSGYSIRSHNLLRAQRALGIDAVAIAHSTRIERVSEGAIDAVPYIWLPRSDGAASSPLSIGRRMIKLAWQIRREVDARGVVLLHAHTPSINGIAALWTARRRRLPLVYEMRGLWEAAAAGRNLYSERSPRYRLARTLETWLIRRASALAVISQGLRAEAVERGVPENRIFLAPNGVDTDFLRPQSRDTDLVRRYGLEEKVVFGFIGFFFSYEGLDLLLRAFAQISPALPQARLLLVGSGEEESALRTLAKDLGVDSRVIFAGAVQHDEIRRWYSVCDVLVYARRTGKQNAVVTPLKPLEAMAMGKPIVATAVGGLQELIRDGDTGLLCGPEDATGLAAALGGLATQPERRDAVGRQARAFVCAERDWTRLAPIYENVYRRLIAAPRGGLG